ncbi:RNA polymerase subunit sigma-24 [Sphingomonas sp. Leaf412]|uniref:RNA polymerase sigma factor n=1 Tax=Sphingomonas sp. Leaf412 TaxID=1736370 RepID=UPI0006F800FF|nr:RNA polymerase sigma factor [Sphingomonas sp. Leaf412]KQT35275.1 RNA polymerase subunit sigma-24 [Sphingomonas sp. Leaf412]
MSAALADHSDGDLARLSRAGDAAAFGEIVRRYKQPLHRTVARLTGDEDEAVDIVQDAFIAAHASIARFDTARPMRTWLTRIAVNKARDWRRRRIVRRLISAILPDEAVEVADDVPPIDEAVADRAELARVEAAIRRLPAPLREVLVLRTIDGLTQAEAGEALDVSEKTVETRLYRARAKLRADLGR